MTFTLPPQTRMGRVALTVADHGRSLDYYRQVIGLKLHRREGDILYLGAGGPDLLLLREQPGARPGRGVTGLYHFALLLPSRRDLARVLRRLIADRAPISGVADHHVSEAIYLTDPDGHGIEIYRDRPRDGWYEANGRIRLTTEPLDVDGILADLSPDAPGANGLPPDTRMGHVHLHVAQIPAAERFYCHLLGFEVMARYGSAASFIAAGGYHHHLGLNTWSGVGAPPPPQDAARLLWYEILLPDDAARQQLLTRLRAHGIPLNQRNGNPYLHDPAQNGIILTIDNPKT